MIPLSPRTLTIVISCAAAGMLLGAVVAFHAVDRDGRADTVSMETPAQVRDPEKTAADLALLPTAHDGRLKSMDEVTAARVRIEDLKKKLKVWNTDFQYE